MLRENKIYYQTSTKMFSICGVILMEIPFYFGLFIDCLMIETYEKLN